jgi:hypothetical protein
VQYLWEQQLDVRVVWLVEEREVELERLAKLGVMVDETAVGKAVGMPVSAVELVGGAVAAVCGCVGHPGGENHVSPSSHVHHHHHH